MSSIDLVVISHASQEVKRIENFSKQLGEYVRSHNLYKNFGSEAEPRNHLYIAAWQFTAHFFGVTAKVVAVDDFTDQLTGVQGFRSVAQAIHVQSGTVISEAYALCTNEEENWDTRPKYSYVNGRREKEPRPVRVPRFQLMSMAQTRAMSKVLSNVFRFVAVLAGFEGSPAEEMVGTEHQKAEPAAEKQPEAQRITDSQRKRFFAIGYQKNVPKPELVEILKKHGFSQAFEITTDKYEQVIRDVEAYKS